MTRSLLLASVAAVAIAPAAATAGGLAEPIAVPAVVAPAPAPVAVSDWTGPYVGLHYGIGSLTSEVPTADVTPEIDSTMYGLHAGYLYDLGSFVLGAEAAYSVTDFEVEGESAPGDFSWTDLTVRAGYDAGPLLPYAFAGITQFYSSEADETEDGTIYGAGLAYKVTDSILIGGEFQRREIEDDDSDLTATGDYIVIRASYQF